MKRDKVAATVFWRQSPVVPVLSPTAGRVLICFVMIAVVK
jgi:hypothetical protein